MAGKRKAKPLSPLARIVGAEILRQSANPAEAVEVTVRLSPGALAVLNRYATPVRSRSAVVEVALLAYAATLGQEAERMRRRERGA